MYRNRSLGARKGAGEKGKKGGMNLDRSSTAGKIPMKKGKENGLRELAEFVQTR
jgi:hypothetical protein